MANNPVYFAYYSTSGAAVDMTGAADVQNFNLNQEELYQEWTDGNWVDHRAVVRTRISGSVALGFRSEAALQAFLTAFAAARKEDGTVHLKSYVNNVETVCDYYAFVDISGAGKWDLVNGRQWQTLALSIKEK